MNHLEKPCPERNQVVKSKKSLDSVPQNIMMMKDKSFAKTFTTLAGEKMRKRTQHMIMKYIIMEQTRQSNDQFIF